MFVCAFTLVDAQTVMTLDECRQRALEHNKSLAVAKTKLEQTKFDMRSYKANFFPQVNLMAADFYSTISGDITIDAFQLPIKKLDFATGTYNYDVTVLPDGSKVFNSYTDFPGMKEEWKVKNVFIGGINLIEPIYAGGKISTAYKMSKIGVNMATENIRLTESEVIVNVDEAYFLAVKAKEMHKVAQSYRSLLDELQKNVQGAVNHGLATRNDLLKVQVKINEADLNLQKADNACSLSTMNLCHMIGLPLDSKIDVEALDLTPENTPNTFMEGSVEARPEFNILNDKTELARHNVNLAKSDYLPNVVMGASYNYSNGVELAGKKLFDDGNATIGVMVKVPIDFFGASSNKVRSAKAAYSIAQIEQQELNEKMQLELALSRNQLSESVSELNLCTNAIQQAEQNVQMSKHQYDVGVEPLSNLLEAQALWQQAAANLANAKCQYMLSLSKCKKASGTM